ncbi:MAG: uracil-DNA glycosylase [Pyrinomonadaceae bacterium]
MNDASQMKNEMLALATELGEQLTYARELGIEFAETAAVQNTAASPSANVSARAHATSHAASQTGKGTTSQSALARNAAAVTNATPPTRSQQLSPPVNDADDAPSALFRKQSFEPTGTTDMAKRTDTSQAEATPAPRETLFGEITPQDDASLARPDETLEDIRADITPTCMRCTLCCEGRTQVVNSDGNREARLMFVGEAPGADEDAQGKPFVGRAGQLLNKIIEAIGMKRADVFIGNVNRCRPANNRTPVLAEAKICKPFLIREIAVVQPEIIVVLGNTAMKNLLDTKEGITKLRGIFQDYNGIKVMPTFHPAYLLRDPTKKRETWEDMKKVRAYLDGQR